jgi:hypothetical protein
MKKNFVIKSGKIVLSDPCYDLGTWCQGVIDKVKNGVWIAEIEDTTDFGGRISRLLAYHINFPTTSDDIADDGELLPFEGGVDSGQFGYFDFDEYRSDESVQGVPRLAEQDQPIIREDEPFYSICCDRTLTKDMWGVIPFGVISSSGVGDGLYPTYGIKNGDGEYVAFTTIFLDRDEDFEDDEDYNDYEGGNIPYDENEQHTDEPDWYDPDSFKSK